MPHVLCALPPRSLRQAWTCLKSKDVDLLQTATWGTPKIYALWVQSHQRQRLFLHQLHALIRARASAKLFKEEKKILSLLMMSPEWAMIHDEASLMAFKQWFSSRLDYARKKPLDSQELLQVFDSHILKRIDKERPLSLQTLRYEMPSEATFRELSLPVLLSAKESHFKEHFSLQALTLLEKKPWFKAFLKEYKLPWSDDFLSLPEKDWSRLKFKVSKPERAELLAHLLRLFSPNLFSDRYFMSVWEHGFLWQALTSPLLQEGGPQKYDGAPEAFVALWCAYTATIKGDMPSFRALSQPYYEKMALFMGRNPVFLQNLQGECAAKFLETFAKFFQEEKLKSAIDDKSLAAFCDLAVWKSRAFGKRSFSL